MTYKKLIKEVNDFISFSTSSNIHNTNSTTIQFSGVTAEVWTTGEVVFTHSKDNRTETHKLEDIETLEMMDDLAIMFYLSKNL